MPSLWAETQCPASESQLVVAKKKVADVREFLAFPNGRRLLVLKGPAGCGKASVLRALCADLGLELVEWSPASGKARSAQDEGDSKTDAFLRFLAQADRYSCLDGRSVPASGRPRVSLVRDFPFTLVEKSGGEAAQGSGAFLERFAAIVNAGSVQRAVLSFNDSRDDNRIINRLLQPISFSAVTQVVFDGLPRTFAQKALDSVCKVQGVPPSAANTAAIAAESGGDLRQAINALQLWTGHMRCAPTNGVATRKRGSKAQQLEAPRCDTQNSLRAPSLGLFHALGRLMWCKRVPPGGDEVDVLAGGAKRRKKANATGPPEPKQLPHELLFPKALRPPLYFVPEDVVVQSQTDSQMLVQWVFTNAPRYYGSVSDLADFAAEMAEADAWGGGGSSFWSARREVESLATEDLAVSVQVRSVLDANLHPVPPSFRDATPANRDPDSMAASAFNMVRPSTWDVQRHRNRRMEELSGHLAKLGPLALGRLSVSPSLIISTLPFVHLLLCTSRGQHPALQRLPHPLMQLLMGLSSPIDGEFLRSGTVDSQASQASQRFQPSQVEETGPPDSWKVALPDDPIEDV